VRAAVIRLPLWILQATGGLAASPGVCCTMPGRTPEPRQMGAARWTWRRPITRWSSRAAARRG
jgi:hypothetical protein